jgi:hypothetical protein
VSEYDWMNNALDLEWLKHFDRHTKAGEMEAYRLLILDGHKSHLNQDLRTTALDTGYSPPACHLTHRMSFSHLM